VSIEKGMILEFISIVEIDLKVTYHYREE